MFDLVTFTMYCQPLLERSPGNQMALVAAALLMSDDKDTVSNTGLCSEYWRDTPCSTRKKCFTNTVLDSIPRGDALRL